MDTNTTTPTTAAPVKPADKKWINVELESGSSFDVVLTYRTKRTKSVVDGKEVSVKSFHPHLEPAFGDLSSRAETLVFLAKAHEQAAPRTNAGSNTLDAGLTKVFDAIEASFLEKLPKGVPLFIMDGSTEVSNPEAETLYHQVMVSAVIQDTIKKATSLGATIAELNAKVIRIFSIQNAPPSAGDKNELAKTEGYADLADAVLAAMAMMEQIQRLTQQQQERAAKRAKAAAEAAASAQ